MHTSKKILAVLSFSLFFTQTCFSAYLPWSQIEKKFQQENLNTKALSHVKCFFDKYSDAVFQKKISNIPGTENRCSGNPSITLSSQRVFGLIDYTAPSNERRMFLVDRTTGEISKMAVAHGKYEAGMFNTRLSENNNSVKYARYFSNEPNSNAPSSGFFAAGIQYVGKFGKSLVLHGLEHDINDNACERTVVIHKHNFVTKSMAAIMSSGCPMISKDYLDHVVNLLQGKMDPVTGDESNGGIVFIYGQRESQWQASTCDGNFNI